MPEQEYQLDQHLLDAAVKAISNGDHLPPDLHRRMTMGILLDVRTRTIRNAKKVDGIEKWKDDVCDSPFLKPKRWHYLVVVGVLFAVSFVVHAIIDADTTVNLAKLLALLGV
jgi:hypothetical protein